MLIQAANRAGLPPAIADAVCAIESGYDAKASGSAGEVGLMQILPSTALLLGYQGSSAGLFDPETNIRFGVQYLAEAWQLADGNLCRALMKYRAGHGEERFSPRSVEYCRRARDHLARLKMIVPAGVDDAAEVKLARLEAGAYGRPKSLPAGASKSKTAYARELEIARLQAAQNYGRPRTTEDSARFWRAHVAHIRSVMAALKRRTTHL
jgi:hypothetical protein